jgi:hypothetical protein
MNTATKPSATAFTAAASQIMPCTCSHAYQDSLHGKGKRVHNPNKNGFRCTVCGSQKN